MFGLLVGLSLFGIGIDLGGTTTIPANAAPIECVATGSLVCSNRPPTARISTASGADRTVTVCDRSVDPEGRPLTRRWDFGDSTRSAAECPSHTYARSGGYTITLTVEDDAEQSDTADTAFRAHAPASQPPKEAAAAGAHAAEVVDRSSRGPVAPAAPSVARPEQQVSPDPVVVYRSLPLEDRHAWRLANAPRVIEGATGVSWAAVGSVMAILIGLLIPPLWITRSRRRRAGAAEFERLATDFIANVSHELRTPLTPVKGYAKMLGTKRLSKDKARTAAGAILSASERLERVIDTLVEVAEIDSGHLSSEAVEIDLAELATEVVTPWRAREPGRSIRVMGDGIVSGNKRMLSIALEQLLDNAVKFSDAGTEVVVEVAPNRSGYDLAVTDRGEGISADELGEIFSDFRQGDSSATRAHGGLGLGLALVRRVARAHGGNVSVRSTPGVGSTFTVSIPAEKARRRRTVSIDRAINGAPVRT